MRVLAITVLVACGYNSGNPSGGDARHDGVLSEGPAPEGPPPMDARQCFGPSGAFSVCFDPGTLPTAPKSVPGTIDSNSTTMCLSPTPAAWINAGQPDACFIVGNTVTVGGDLRATGARPIVLVATDTLTINGNIDVSSKRNTAPAAAGALPNSGPCPGVNATTPQTSNGLGAGGAGGSFTTPGGPGGNSDGGAGNAGRAGNSMGTPTLLRGGCPGIDGATPANGFHGDGGGAIYLLAGNAIAFTKANAWINASGAGAQHGQHSSGGSGGGSGGMIVLFAPTITPNGLILVANGGGGAAGGANNADGKDGADPSPTMSTMPAPGGTSGGGGDGGAGYALGSNARGGSADSQGGGGGGGASGYIRANPALGTVTASPAVDVVP